MEDEDENCRRQFFFIPHPAAFIVDFSGVFAPLVGALVFKTSGRLEESRQWVRFPYTPVFARFFMRVSGFSLPRDCLNAAEPADEISRNKAIPGNLTG